MAPDPRPEVFAAIGHPVRRRILDLLAEEDRPVNAIASNFAMSRPAVSQHLRVLLEAGLVSEQRHGRERRYRLVPEELAQIYDWLAHYQRFWQGRLQRLSEQMAAPSSPVNDAPDSTLPITPLPRMRERPGEKDSARPDREMRAPKEHDP